ncbi:MAG: ribosome biogenesis GTP-binding protein YihA/YsxC [Burkholderiaceae bacterium]|nr:ribosome biogenesis GTP-binding protein YihA/YsxC [Burkholderiaceae bacterium]MCX8005357.1 ribosome biogenesis GTP-binding protein YihA/YsxC [Burkholderiaceae bacterium]
MILFETTRFVTSVAALPDLARAPLAPLPEVAVVGRSNAGKSTLINALANQRQLARASKTPGRTQLLNFFEVARREDDARRPGAYLVDLPGYGFARADPARRAAWDDLAGGYLRTRRDLAGVVLVMDARRPLLPVDEALLAWLAQRDGPPVRLLFVLTKSDQLRRAERTEALRLVQNRSAGLPQPAPALLFSALTGEGLQSLRAEVGALMEPAPHDDAPLSLAKKSPG